MPPKVNGVAAPLLQVGNPDGVGRAARTRRAAPRDHGRGTVSARTIRRTRGIRIAVQASVQVVRAFVRLREMLIAHKDLAGC
jgi:hypothetical protein